MSNTEIVRNTDHGRYEIHVDGELAGFTQFFMRGDSVAVFPHTEIDDRFAGRGLAKTLIGQALDNERALGHTVIARCPFVAAFIAKNPEYQDLLAEPLA